MENKKNKNTVFYVAFGVALLFLWYKSKKKKPIEQTIISNNNTDLSTAENLPNSLDVVSNPVSGTVQIVPSPSTIMDYSKAINLNDSNCCNCTNSITGYKIMPYTC
jgi:hypothetical protein